MTTKNFDAALTMIDGSKFEENEKPVILKDVIAQILCGNYQDEVQTLNGLDKYKRAVLALKVSKGGDIKLTGAEIGIISDIVGKRGSTVAVYQIFNVLDGK